MNTDPSCILNTFTRQSKNMLANGLFAMDLAAKFAIKTELRAAFPERD